MTENGKHHRIERWLIPLGIVAFCVAAFWISTGFDHMPPILKRGIQPSDFPQLVAALIIALTVLMALRDPVSVDGPIGWTTFYSIALIGVFAAATTIDFFLALGIFVTGLAALWGERRLKHLVLVGLIIPVCVFMFFDLVFEIRFPRGLLTNLWYG